MTEILDHPPKSNDYSHIETRLSEFTSPYHKSVSVVIPHYNNAEILEKTLASLTLQTYPSSLIEVIISDDGSDEDISYLIPMFQSYFPIRILFHERLGHRVATMRNHGILAARHDVILSLDCDIICPPKTVEEHLKWFHVSDEVATVGARRFVDTFGVTARDIVDNVEAVLRLPDVRSISNTNPNGLHDRRMGEFQFIKHHPFPCNCFHGANIAYKREHAIHVSLWDEAFNGNPNYEDIEFGHRLWKSGIFLVYSPGAKVLHQENCVVPLQQRICGGAINRHLLLSKVPGLREFRSRLATRCPTHNGSAGDSSNSGSEE
jgi:chondroitin synthase